MQGRDIREWTIIRVHKIPADSTVLEDSIAAVFTALAAVHGVDWLTEAIDRLETSIHDERWFTIRPNSERNESANELTASLNAIFAALAAVHGVDRLINAMSRALSALNGDSVNAS